jgi:hypothetical protein
VPAAARALGTLPRVDYEDAFLVEIGPTHGRTGEQWAPAILEGAPMGMRRRLRWGWFALGLQLGSTRSDQLVLGWEVRRSTPDFALLGASSRLGLPAERSTGWEATKTDRLGTQPRGGWSRGAGRCTWRRVR